MAGGFTGQHIYAISHMIVSIGKSIPISKIIDFFHIFLGYGIVLFSAVQIFVHVAPINRYDSCCILCRLHSSFDLKRIYSAFRNLRKELQRI